MLFLRLFLALLFASSAQAGPTVSGGGMDSNIPVECSGHSVGGERISAKVMSVDWQGRLQLFVYRDGKLLGAGAVRIQSSASGLRYSSKGAELLLPGVSVQDLGQFPAQLSLPHKTIPLTCTKK